MNAKNQINWKNIFYLLKYEFQTILPSLKKAIVGLLIGFTILYVFLVLTERPQTFNDQIIFFSMLTIDILFSKNSNKTLFSKQKTYSFLMLPSSNTEKVLSKIIISSLLVLLFLPLFNFLFTLVAGIICELILSLSINLFNPFNYVYLFFINMFFFFIPLNLLSKIYCKKYVLGRVIVWILLSTFIILVIWFVKEYFIYVMPISNSNPLFIKILNFFKNHPNLFNFIKYYQWIVSAPLLWSLYYLEFKKMEV